MIDSFVTVPASRPPAKISLRPHIWWNTNDPRPSPRGNYTAGFVPFCRSVARKVSESADPAG
jgi:hypothetical protein